MITTNGKSGFLYEGQEVRRWRGFRGKQMLFKRALLAGHEWPFPCSVVSPV